MTLYARTKPWGNLPPINFVSGLNFDAVPVDGGVVLRLNEPKPEQIAA